MNSNTLNLLGEIVTTQAQQPQGFAGIMNMLLPFILIFAIFYFLVIMPQKKQQKKHADMLNRLQKGENILTNSGIYGKVVEVKPNAVKVEIAPKVVVTIQKNAIASKVVEEVKEKSEDK